MAKKQYLDLAGLTTYNDEIQAQLDGKANSSHNHAASNITSGTLAIERGGTGNNWGYIQTGALADSTIGALATAEGRNTTASGDYCHAEGNYTEATGSSSHAEGQNTEASGTASHAEGEDTVASGKCAHAEGVDTVALGFASHAGGCMTKAVGDYQTVIGKYNVEDADGIYAFIIGNGSDDAPSNAFTVGWNGDIYPTANVRLNNEQAIFSRASDDTWLNILGVNSSNHVLINKSATGNTYIYGAGTILSGDLTVNGGDITVENSALATAYTKLTKI